MSKKYYDEDGNEVFVEEPRKRGGCLKWLAIIIGAFVLLGVIGALVGGNGDSSSSTSETTENSESSGDTQNASSENADAAEPDVKSDPLVEAGQLPYEITLREPDSIGNIYADVTFTNNSDYPITSYSVNVTLQDSNERSYYSTFDTVMPGETSSVFSSFGPQTGNLEDIEVDTIEYRVHLEDGTEQAVSYDTKLETYDVLHITQ